MACRFENWPYPCQTSRITCAGYDLKVALSPLTNDSIFLLREFFREKELICTNIEIFDAVEQYEKTQIPYKLRIMEVKGMFYTNRRS